MLALCSYPALAAYSYTLENGPNATVYNICATTEAGTYNGMKFLMKTNASQIEVRYDILSDCATFIIWNSTKGKLLEVNHSNSTQTANMTMNFIEGVQYYIVSTTYSTYACCNRQKIAATSYPLSRTTFNWTTMYDGSGDNNGAVNGVGFFIVRTGESDVPPETAPFYNYTLNSSIDINSTTVSNVNITLKVAPTSTILSNSSAIIYYKLHTGLNSGCSVYYGKLCNRTDVYLSKNMTKINNSYFSALFSDNDYLPGYYPYVYTYMESETVRYNYSSYNNNYLKFNIFNMSTNASAYFIGLEFAANNKTGTSGVLNIFYCNSSYISGNPATSKNCVIVDSFAPNVMAKHAHPNTKHYFIPISINNVTKTSSGSFVYISTAPNLGNAWTFEYMLNSSYNNESFQIGDYTSWTNTSRLFEMHLHSYLPTEDYFGYYANFTDGNLSFNQTYIVYDFLNLTQFPPSLPFVYTPACNAEYTIGSKQNTYIIYNWSASTDINPSDDITLDFCIYDATLASCIYSLEINGTGSITNNTHNVSLNTSIGYAGYFYNYFQACDEFGGCDTGYDINCPLILCVNDWQKSIQPCSGGVRIINYTDMNSCALYLDYPADGGSYENCTSITEVEFTFSNNAWLFILYLFLIIVFIILAFNISYLFLIFAGLVSGLFAFLFKTVIGDSSNLLFIVMLCVAGLFIIGGLAAALMGKKAA